jgi:chorismate dehydratase
MLRIGRIAYANCTPIFHALNELYPADIYHYQYVRGVPFYLNGLLSSGSIDVCPSSSITFSACPDQYLIIPDLSISSCGPVQSVILFSTVPIEDLNGKTVLLSSESATSVNLLKIVLRKCFGSTSSFLVTGKSTLAALKEAPAVLLIGDAALRAVQESSAVHVYDLGEIWYQWTGLPFVFALWLTTRTAVEQHGDELHRLARQLCLAKFHALEHLEGIAEVSPEKEWLGQERLVEYWNVLSYDLSEFHIRGLNLFYQLAAELNLIAAAPELAFLTQD